MAEKTKPVTGASFGNLTHRVVGILGITLVIVAFIIFICARLNHHASEQLLRRYQQEQLISVSQQSSRLVDKIGYIRDDLVSLSRNPAIQSFEEDRVRPLLRDFHDRHKNFVVAGYLMNAEGILQYVEGKDRSGEGVDVSYQDHVKRLFETAAPVVSGSFLAVEGYYAISIHAPVFVDGELKGSTATLVRWDGFGSWFEMARVSRDSFTILLDPGGRFIYHPDAEYTGKRLSDSPAICIDGRRVSGEYFRGSRAGVFSGPFFENKRYVAACRPFTVGEQTYSLISCAPHDEIMKPLTRFTRLSGILAGLALLAVIVSLGQITYYFHRDKRRWWRTQRKLQGEIAERRRIEARIQHRLSVEEALAAATRILLQRQGVDLEEVLRIIGESIQVNRAYIFELKEDRTLLDNTHEWCDPATEPQIENNRNMDASGFAWWMSRLERGENIVIPDVDELPDEAAFERQVFEHHQIRALVAVPISAADGALVGFIGFDDTTGCRRWSEEDIRLLRIVAEMVGLHWDRELAWEGLRQSEVRHRRIVENTSDLIILTRPNGVISYASPASREVMGYEPDEMVGTRLWTVPPAEGSENETAAGDSLPARNLEYRLLTKKGGDRWVSHARSPIFRGGKVHMVVNVIRDITQRKRMERELLKVQKIESIGILAGGIAHDFNNLLTAILGNISIMKLHVEAGGRLQQRLEEAEKASLRARDLTQQLLTFSKGGEPIVKPVRLGAFLRESAKFSLSGSKAKSEFDIQDGLHVVEVDEGQMSQVMNNLIINAVQAVPEGGTVRVAARNITLDPGAHWHGLTPRPGDYVAISVSDTGPGIPEENLSKIFDPFFTTRPDGSGLGLATSYSIITKHGGHLTVESETGTGTTFEILLPASLKRVRDEQPPEKTPDVVGGRILLMDDEAIVREVAGDMLGLIGFDVVTVEDGVDALEAFRAALSGGTRFDIVLLDLTIPGGMGGTEVVKEIRRLDPDIMAVVSSGYSTDPVMSRYRDYGFDGVVTKPYKLEELRVTLYRLLNSEPADMPSA